MAVAGAAEQSHGEAEANVTPLAISRAVLGHRDEVSGQTQRRREQRTATLAFVASVCQVRPTGGCEHQSHGVGEPVAFSSALGTARPPHQELGG